MKWITAAIEHIRDRDKKKEMEGGRWGERMRHKSHEEEGKAGKQTENVHKKSRYIRIIMP